MSDVRLILWDRHRISDERQVASLREGAPTAQAAQDDRFGLAVTATVPVATVRHRALQIMIVGELYGRSDGRLVDLRRIVVGQDRDAAAVAARIVRECWGAYFLVVADQESVCAMVDPSGQLPVRKMAWNGIVVVATDFARSWLDRCGFRVDVKLDVVARVMAMPAYAIYSSPLAGVEPLVPGRLVSLFGRNTARTIWRPDEIAGRNSIPDRHAIRRAVTLSTTACATRSTLLTLSGGLDSAVIASALGQGPSGVSAVNFVTLGGEGDERRYAAAVAARNGLRLTMRSPSALPDLTRLAGLPQGAQAFVFGLDSAFEDIVDAAAAETRSEVVITGQGGDAVFFQPATAYVTLDRIRRRGVGGLAPALLADDARRGRTSVWAVLGSALKGLSGDRWRRRRRFGEEFLTRGMREQLGAVDDLHPWLDGTSKLSAAKRVHMTMMADAQLYMSRRAFGRTLVRHPLLSQPVVETMMGIAVSDLAYGFNDRQLARSIFADALPACVAERRTKGAAGEHYSRSVLAALPHLREFLLDGALVRARIIDRDALGQALTPEHLFYRNDYSAIIMQVSCEAWLRSWS